MKALAVKTDMWDDILELVGSRLNRHIFDTWFKRVEFLGFDEEEHALHLKAGSITRDWVVNYYSELIDHCLRATGFDDYEVVWTIDPKEDPSDQTQDQFAEIADRAYGDRPQTQARTSGKSAANGAAGAGERALNPKYTFEKFVVGTCNQFAHAASLGAAKSPGTAYNPLFIYGGTGLGKTHLMHAIGHQIRSADQHLRVSYITSEKFMNELINAIRYEKTNSFREKFRSIDVLLMDDVQFFAGKERTQEEFFHTFNALHNDQKQIVISSDCPPREIPTLEERLHSRFQWGLIADLEPPDLETKVAILKRKAEMDGIDLPDEIAIFIAGKIKSNVRELEGSLVRLVAIASLRGLPITKMLAQDALKNIIDSERPEGLTMERIAKVVSSHYKLTVEEMKSKSNSRAIAFPRQIAMYLCKRLTKHSYPEIGREFGGKHHTTVMHSFEKIDDLSKEDRNFHKTIGEFIDSLCN